MAHDVAASAACRDMPIRTTVAAAFAAVRAANTTAEVEDALVLHFDPPGSDLQAVLPPDWSAVTSAFDEVQASNTRELACRIHQLWPLLFRQVCVATRSMRVGFPSPPLHRPRPRIVHSQVSGILCLANNTGHKTSGTGHVHPGILSPRTVSVTERPN
jgi:hypothetical protein